jgi:hypothetical protein
MVPPAKSLIKGIRAIGYNFSTAVADIIDNSITAEATWVKLYFDPIDDEPYFLIFDNGHGMNAADLENAMLFGSNREDKEESQKDLGRFGLGLKSASLSQCKKFYVISKKFGRTNGMFYDLDEIEETNSWDLRILHDSEINSLPCVDKLNELESGTIIIWTNFDKLESESGQNFESTFRSTVAEMKKHIEYVFHRFYDNVLIYINEKRIEQRDPFLLSSLKAQRGRETAIKIPNYKSPISVIPHILPYANSLTQEEKALLGNPKSIYDEQGFYIYRNKRLIFWGNWMRMGYKSELNKLARIQVDIPSEMDEMWMLDVKKSSAKIPELIKEQIRSAIDESIIKSKRVIRYRGENEAKSDCPIWNRIKDRDGFVKYEINRDNPLLKILIDNVGTNERDILEELLSQIEFYLPKSRIQNDNADAINIINGNIDDVEESRLIDSVIKCLQLFPEALVEFQLDKILASEAYSKIMDKKTQILKVMDK